ncbi:hypothetical protein BT69DRAFT_1357079 [Atractiella rhizophila]|nr:hypothetical protein BT69DRAFT_1357079 [Atractiella rhizophila]
MSQRRSRSTGDEGPKCRAKGAVKHGEKFKERKSTTEVQRPPFDVTVVRSGSRKVLASSDTLPKANNLVDIFDVKSSTSADLKSPKARQENDEIQQHIEDESYVYAPYETPVRCRDSTRKALKAGAYLCSPALFKVARIIIHGPATMNSASNRARGATIGSQLSIRQITIPLMAYASTLARYALSSDTAFSAEGITPIKPGTEEVNNYRDHYRRTVTLLSTVKEQHENKFRELMSLWNKEVFPRDDDETDSSRVAHGHGTSDADILEGFDVDVHNEDNEEGEEMEDA